MRCRYCGIENTENVCQYCGAPMIRERKKRPTKRDVKTRKIEI